MKIGFVLDDSLDKADGVQQYVLTLGQFLKSQGHSVHYLVGQTSRTDIQNVHSLSRNLQVHFNQNRVSTPRPADKGAIKALLDRERFDVLHVQMPYSPFLAARIIKAVPVSTAVIGTFHIIPYSRAEALATRLLRELIRRSLKRFDTVLAVSPAAAQFAARSFKLNAEVLPNVVSIMQLHQGKKLARYDDGKLNIVFLGRLVERKGCSHFLKALDDLHKNKDLQNVRVLICGKGPLEQHLKDFVRQHHLGQIVHFTGFISEADKADYLATANIAVMPSTGGESFGIVLIEAMAAGSEVVIGGDNIGYRTVLGERPEQLVDPLDTTAFAKTLRHYIRSSKARKSAAKWQRTAVESYDVRKVGAEISRRYEEEIAKKHTSSNN